MLATHFADRSMVVRELMPQDLKFEMEKLSQDEAIAAANLLAKVVGKAHARQMDAKTRQIYGKGKRLVATAVEAEKKSPLRKKPKVDDTELGKSLQQQLGASGVLVNRRMEDVATRVLERLPSSGREQ